MGVSRSNLDGSAPEQIQVKGFHWSHGLALDLSAQKLYVTDAFYDKIVSMNVDGTDMKVKVFSNLPKFHKYFPNFHLIFEKKKKW